MRIVCWQTILMKYHTSLCCRKLGKILQNLSSAAVVTGALRVNPSSGDSKITTVLQYTNAKTAQSN